MAGNGKWTELDDVFFLFENGDFPLPAMLGTTKG